MTGGGDLMTAAP